MPVLEATDRELGAAIGRVERLLESERQKRDIPGLSAAIVRGETLLWAGGSGCADLERKIPAGPDTLYRLGSVTKLFTAAALMLLRDEGRLSLDDPLQRHLPELRIPSRFPDAAPITIRQAAAHVAGLPNDAPLPYWETLEFPTGDAILASLPNTEMVFPPLTEFNYSNLGYALLGCALERISGRPYRELIADLLLVPLAMQRTSFSLDHPEMAVGYLKPSPGRRLPAPRYELRGFDPAGGLVSSAQDMARFISWQLGAGQGRLLSDTTLREMRSPVFLTPSWQSARAIGWQLSRLAGNTLAGHGGAELGYTAEMALIPAANIGVVVLAGCDADTAAISRALLESLLPALDQGAAQQTAQAAGESERYSGRYVLPGVATVDVALSGGKLIATSPAAPGLEIGCEPDGEHTFRMHGGPMHGERAVFTTGAEGQITHMRAGPYTLARAGELGRVRTWLLLPRAVGAAARTYAGILLRRLTRRRS